MTNVHGHIFSTYGKLHSFNPLNGELQWKSEINAILSAVDDTHIYDEENITEAACFASTKQMEI